MKKVLVVLFAIVVLMQSVPIVAENYVIVPDSFDDLTEEQLIPYFNLITDTIELYNRLERSSTIVIGNDKKSLQTDSIPFKYVNSEIENLPLSTTLKGYLKSKLIYDTSYNRASGLLEEYIDGSYTVLDWKAIGDILVCKVACHLELQYAGLTERSYLGECVQIGVQNPAESIIIDWYNEDPASFESSVRGGQLDLFDFQNLMTNLEVEDVYASIDSLLTQTEISMQNVYDEFQIEYFAMEDASFVSQIENSSITTSISFDNWMDCGYRAKHYAQTILTNEEYIRNPIPINSTDTYVDMSEVSENNWDCTNFISHCLRAGFTMKFGVNGSGNSWYFRGLSDRSSSWAGVNQLYQFIVYNNSQQYKTGLHSSYIKNATIATSVSSIPNVNERPEIGDVIQIKYNTAGAHGYPGFGHSTLVTSIGSNGTICVSWRTGPHMYGYNKPLGERFPPASSTADNTGGHIYRFIKLQYPF